MAMQGHSVAGGVGRIIDDELLALCGRQLVPAEGSQYRSQLLALAHGAVGNGHGEVERRRETTEVTPTPVHELEVAEHAGRERRCVDGPGHVGVKAFDRDRAAGDPAAHGQVELHAGPEWIDPPVGVGPDAEHDVARKPNHPEINAMTPGHFSPDCGQGEGDPAAGLQYPVDEGVVGAVVVGSIANEAEGNEDVMDHAVEIGVIAGSGLQLGGKRVEPGHNLVLGRRIGGDRGHDGHEPVQRRVRL